MKGSRTGSSTCEWLSFVSTEWIWASVSHLRCWDRSPCPDMRAPASLDPPPPRPVPAPPGQRNGGVPAARAWGTARTTSGPLSSAAVGAGAKIPEPPRARPDLRSRAAAPRSGSNHRPLCPAMAASTTSTKRTGTRTTARCHRKWRWRTAGSRRSLRNRKDESSKSQPQKTVYTRITQSPSKNITNKTSGKSALLWNLLVLNFEACLFWKMWSMTRLDRPWAKRQ